MYKRWYPARARLVLVALVCAVVAVSAAPAQAGQAGTGSPAAAEAFGRRLAEQVTPEGVLRHLTALERIAVANGGNRASGFPGFDAASRYVSRQLAAAGLRVSRQEFTFLDYERTGPTQLARLSPQPRDYVSEQEVLTLEWSASGEVTGQVVPIDVTIPPTPTPSSTSGCEAADFAGFTPGSIALVQRGTCAFRVKALNAIDAGATAIIAFNEGQPGRTDPFPGNLQDPNGIGAPVDIPGLSISFADGAELVQLSQQEPVTVRLQASTRFPIRVTHNVIAETRGGRSDHVIMAGAHLDSVVQSQGMNDNGTGVSALLEVALQLADERVRNKVRFAFWGAEERGLIGSNHYVTGLSGQPAADLALYLNFDVLGSPNWGRFVYDGDGSATGESFPDGSTQIEALLTGYFAGAGEPVQEDVVNSDHRSFAAAGIPVGGLFTGVTGIKTEEQAALWGGTAGERFDACADLPCDTFGNVNQAVLVENADAVAFAIGRYAVFAADIPA
jgi:Zn-dependent M28 family amino/carboxypeptidase